MRTFNTDYFTTQHQVYLVLKKKPNMTNQQLSDLLETSKSRIEAIVKMLRDHKYISTDLVKTGVSKPIRTVTILRSMLPTKYTK